MTRGWVVWVDEELYDSLNAYRWTAQDCYAIRYHYPDGRYGKRVRVMMHREILGLTDPAVECDHRDHYRSLRVLDNRRDNLRPCTRLQNAKNLSHRQRKTGKKVSRYKGVTWCRKYWLARIGTGYKNKHLGCFRHEHHAALAYDYAARQLYGDFAACNFPTVESPADALTF